MQEEESIGRQSYRRLWLVCAMILTLTLLITARPFGFSARAIEVDGLLKEKMWVELEPFTVIRLRDQSNCAVEEAKIFVSFDERDQITYIGCRLLHQKASAASPAEGETSPQGLSGVVVRVEGEEPLTVTVQEAAEQNSASCHMQGAASSLSDTNTTVELLIGQKGGFRDPLQLQLSFLDADGNSSNAYSLAIPSPTPSTTPVVVTTRGETTTAPPKTAKPTTSRTQKETQPTTQRTTQEKTTVEKTTKEKTTKEKTTKEKTTKLKTTKAPRTTKPKTTKAKTTKAKTTKAKTALPPADNEELLQAVLTEQAGMKRAFYVAAGLLVFAIIVVGTYMLKKKDE